MEDVLKRGIKAAGGPQRQAGWALSHMEEVK